MPKTSDMYSVKHSRLKSWFLTTITALLCLTSNSLKAQEATKWWFEVEVVVFKRNISPNEVAEKFTDELNVLPPHNGTDLLTPYLHPDPLWAIDGQPICTFDIYAVENTPAEFFEPNPLLMKGKTEFELAMEPNQSSSRQYGYPRDERKYDPSYVIGDSPANRQFNLKPLEDFLLIPQQSTTENEQWVDVSISQQYKCIDHDAYLAAQFNPFTESTKPEINAVPTVIDGIEWLHQLHPYLLAKNSLQLNKLAKDIAKQRDLTQLLHLGWRQKVLFGQQKAPYYRLMAGTNFASHFDSKGNPIALPVDELAVSSLVNSSLQDEQQIDLMDKIRDALSQQQPLTSLPTEMVESNVEQQLLDELWELDGNFKVFLRYIGSTPYLHIESELDYRAPILVTNEETGEVTEQLKSFPFKQLRRVISTQMHYFDHPLFGMVVQIRRYTPPMPDVDEQSEE